MKNRIFGGVLLIAGTAIGAGMLALPVSTGLAGYLPSMVILVICWIYMSTTAFLFLEVNMWMGEGVNIVSMAEFTLGVIGKIVSWVVYLFLLYALTTAYLAGCSSMFLSSISAYSKIAVPVWAAPLPFIILFGICVYLGTKPVDIINRLLMLGLVATYACLAAFVSPHIESANLATSNWSVLLPSLAVVVTSFGYHIIIPTLSAYLHYDLKKLRLAIIFGSIIPLLVYIVWETFVLGVIPLNGDFSLTWVSQQGSPEVSMIQSLQQRLSHPSVAVTARAFSYFAILTSFLGVSLSLSDFLADGLKIKKTVIGRTILAVLTFVPPFLIAITYPQIFIRALQYAGVFVAILLGILPAAMVWSGRYRLKLVSSYKVIGGRPLLLAVILFSLFVIVVDVLFS